jgi:putative SOS response-associated peptidase YedK
MPVILPPTTYASWLDMNFGDAAGLMVAPRTELVLQAVSQRVNSPANDDARCIEPRDDGPQVGENLRLF